MQDLENGGQPQGAEEPLLPITMSKITLKRPGLYTPSHSVPNANCPSNGLTLAMWLSAPEQTRKELTAAGNLTTAVPAGQQVLLSEEIGQHIFVSTVLGLCSHFCLNILCAFPPGLFSRLKHGHTMHYYSSSVLLLDMSQLFSSFL